MSGKYVRSYEGKTPILLEMPHSGLVGLFMPNNIPSVLAPKVRFVSESVRRTISFGCDSAVPQMSGFISLVASGKVSGVSNDLARVYCDTNRDKNQVSSLVLEGGDPNDHHHGIIWGRTVPTGLDLSASTEELKKIVDMQCEPTLSTPLTNTEFATLIDDVYDPYHAAIQAHHQRIIKDNGHGFCIHLALHSLPAISIDKVRGGYVCGSKATRGPFDKAKNTLPDVILIHANFTSSERIFIEIIRDVFQSAGLIVEDGKGPFSGSDTGVTKIYGSNKPGRVSVIGIEHVTHDTEPRRHLGSSAVDTKKAMALQPVYAKVIENLLKE